MYIESETKSCFKLILSMGIAWNLRPQTQWGDLEDDLLLKDIDLSDTPIDKSSQSQYYELYLLPDKKEKTDLTDLWLNPHAFRLVDKRPCCRPCRPFVKMLPPLFEYYNYWMLHYNLFENQYFDNIILTFL